MDTQLALALSHEQANVPDTWDIRFAVALGMSCLDRAISLELPITIMVRHLGRTVFAAGLPGSASINDNWAMRKIRLVELFEKSSMLLKLEHEADGVSVYDRHSISELEYAAAGGALPLRNSSGLVGVVVISGLDQWSDHIFCVDALAAFNG